MGSIRGPEAVKLFMGILTVAPDSLPRLEAELAAEWGPVDVRSPVVPFDHTGYYAPEMGPDIFRRWIGFERLVPPAVLPAVKCRTNDIEAGLAAPAGGRRVNLDPGYLALPKVVLASTKDFGHRVYLADGIFAEVTLIYYKGEGFRKLPWTYPDYVSKTGSAFLHELRAVYHAQLNPGPGGRP